MKAKRAEPQGTVGVTEDEINEFLTSRPKEGYDPSIVLPFSVNQEEQDVDWGLRHSTVFDELIRGVEAPKKVLEGLISPEEGALDTTMAVMGSALAGGRYVPKGALTMFAGPTAKKADHAKLAVAKEMDDFGADRDTIFKNTGWFKEKDGKWRFEIDDSQVEFTPDDAEHLLRYGDLAVSLMNTKLRILDNMDPSDKSTQLKLDAVNKKLSGFNDIFKSADINIEDVDRDTLARTIEAMSKSLDDIESNRNKMLEGGTQYLSDFNEESHRYDFVSNNSGKKARLEDVIPHEELYENYPQLRDAPVGHRTGSASAHGSYDPSSGRFNLNRDVIHPGEQGSVILHEGQHAIQEIENTARGSSPSSVLIDSITGNLTDEADKVFDDLVKVYRKTSDTPEEAEKRAAREVYYRALGEREARLVQARSSMSPEERRKIPPWETEDNLGVSEEDVIVNISKSTGVEPEDIVKSPLRDEFEKLPKSVRNKLPDQPENGIWGYHGTAKSRDGEEYFDIKFANPNDQMLGEGFYFTLDPKVAERYANMRAAKGLKPVPDSVADTKGVPRGSLIEPESGEFVNVDSILSGETLSGGKIERGQSISRFDLSNINNPYIVKNSKDLKTLKDRLPEIKKQGYDSIMFKDFQDNSMQIMVFPEHIDKITKGGNTSRHSTSSVQSTRDYPDVNLGQRLGENKALQFLEHHGYRPREGSSNKDFTYDFDGDKIVAYTPIPGPGNKVEQKSFKNPTLKQMRDWMGY